LTVSPTLEDGLVERENTYAPFLPLLAQATSLEEAFPLLTSTVLTTLLARDAISNPKGREASDQALPKQFTYLSTLAKSSDSGLQDIAVMAYSSLLRNKRSRELFWEHREVTVKPLIAILRTAAGVSSGGASTLWNSASTRTTTEGFINGGIDLQLLYHVLLVMWQLSFEGATIGDGLEEYANSIFISGVKSLQVIASTMLFLFSHNYYDYLPRRKQHVFWCQRYTISYLGTQDPSYLLQH
jgi:V-type H+-transporting ATPase subunit H